MEEVREKNVFIYRSIESDLIRLFEGLPELGGGALGSAVGEVED